MKRYLILLLCPLALTLLNFSANPAADANKTLTEVARRLNDLQIMSYHYDREINNIKNNSFSKSDADCYLEFAEEKVARFQFNSATSLQVYNGTEYFYLSKTEKTYQLTEKPVERTFSSLSYFYNSIAGLRSVLPAIIKDDSVTRSQRDTLINSKPYKVVSLAMQNKAIDYLGSFRRFTIKITLLYDLIIDPVTYLPYQLLEHNNVDGDGYNTRVTYTKITAKPAQPDAFSWFYSTYKKEYRPAVKPKTIPMIAQGADLPDWNLPQYQAGDALLVKKGDFNTKLVLMDFWIKNCGYCMESFPFLRALQEKYGKQNVDILAINAYDDKADVAFFYKREKPGYKMLYGGEGLAKQLGIYAYPAVVLADKTGKVIYAGDFNKEKIDQLIRENR